MQNEVAMPTKHDLCNLKYLIDFELKTAYSQGPGLRILRGQENPDTLLSPSDPDKPLKKFNGHGRMLVGKTRNGSDVWAHAIYHGSTNEVLCDIPRRMLLVFMFVNREKADQGVIMVSYMTSLTEVATWDKRVEGETLVDRFKFVYDNIQNDLKTMYDA